MKLKTAIIQWINETPDDYDRGKLILIRAQPDGRHPTSCAEILARFGQLLRLGIPDIELQPLPQSSPSASPMPPVDDDDDQPESVHMDIKARLSLDITDYTKQRIALHNSLHLKRTDAERKKTLLQLGEVQHQITATKKIIRKIEQGEKVNLEVYIPKPTENFMDEPESDVELMKKIGNLRTRISKRKTILKNNPEGSPKYLKALKEFNEYDKAKCHLEKALRDRTAGQ